MQIKLTLSINNNTGDIDDVLLITKRAYYCNDLMIRLFLCHSVCLPSLAVGYTSTSMLNKTRFDHQVIYERDVLYIVLINSGKNR